MRRLLVTLVALAWTASNAGAYYHFLRYTSRTAPFSPVAEKFDLNALPNKTVTFFLSDTAASQISRPEYLPSAIGAIRDAARAWNSVETSDLRVAFGGIAASNTTQNTPGADIVFEEMDPLTLGLTATNARSTTPGAPFVPITRPLVRLNRNLGNWGSPSLTEAFFLTVVHEMGHALGLQHTFTASVMSTEAAGRATSLYSPLTVDDMAGISALYPARSFSQSLGSISGRVALPNGQGLHLASVVAIRPTGGAVSALTEPDGRYRIDGLQPGPYFVYAHPVPPADRAGVAPGGLSLPLDVDGRQTAADGPFDTLFYQGFGTAGTRDQALAQSVNVNGGLLAENVNFTTNRRGAYALSSVATYSFFDQTPVRPGYLNQGGTLVAAGSGLASNGVAAAGLSVSFLGGTPVLAVGGLRVFSGSYLALDLQATSTFSGSGPRHVIFSLPDDVYLQPAGLNLVQTPPPSINAVTSVVEGNNLRAVALAGSMLRADTKYYFDGVPGTFLRFDDTNGRRALVAPPPGTPGLRALITAFNPDGQNSMFLQAKAPVLFNYDSGDTGAAIFSPNALAAGTESLVEITGTSGNFADGLAAVGFGSSDVQVRRTWVVAPNRIWANVWVAPNASLTAVQGSVVNGLQVISQAGALQIAANNGRTPVLGALANILPTVNGIFPGATMILSGANLTGGTITIGDRPATIISGGAAQITFVTPAGLSAGPAALKFSNGVDTVSLGVSIDAIPAGGLTSLIPGDTINATHTF